jgi:hypothetical protein
VKSAESNDVSYRPKRLELSQPVVIETHRVHQRRPAAVAYHHHPSTRLEVEAGVVRPVRAGNEEDVREHLFKVTVRPRWAVLECQGCSGATAVRRA